MAQKDLDMMTEQLDEYLRTTRFHLGEGRWIMADRAVQLAQRCLTELQEILKKGNQSPK